MKVAVLMDIHAMEPFRLDLPNPASKPMFFRHAGSMVADLKKFSPDLLILGGDLVDGVFDFVGTKDSMPGQYEVLFRIFRDLFANALVAPCPGNHEWGCGDPDLSMYADYSPLPQNGPDDDRNNTWSFAYGGVGFQFRADDAPKTGKARIPRQRKSAAPWIRDNLRWLKEKCGADTIIDVNHYPVFHWGDGKGGATQTPIVFDPLGQPGVTDVFDASGGVRIALSGHTHMHQRTFPLLCDGGVRATTTEQADYGPDTKGTIYMQCPSLWRGYSNPVANALVACSGKPSFPIDVHGYAGYVEMTATPQDIVIETFLYDKPGNVCHEKVDRFRIRRPK
jgi:3',5'-cyclic AMP phosphodiesterase CpdA